MNTLDAAGNTWPIGIWSDGETMWVADNLDEKLYAYDSDTSIRDPDKDFNTLEAAGNTSPAGIWSGGETMWVADDRADKLYAYNVNTRTRDPWQDFNTLEAAVRSRAPLLRRLC